MPLFHNNFDFIPRKQDDPGLFARMLLKFVQNWAFILNGQISFGDGVNPDNINGVWTSVPFTIINTDVAVLVPTLGRVPVGYIVMSKNAPCDIYNGSVPPAKNVITLRSTALATVVLFVV